MRIIIILIMIALASTPLRVEPLSFEQRWEPVRQIPQPRELTFEERWAPVRQLPQMLDFSTMPPPEPKNQTAQIDTALFDPKPILSQEESDNLPSVPIRIIRVKVEQKPVPAFMFAPEATAPALLRSDDPPVPVPVSRPATARSRPKVGVRVASVVRDVCTRHGMHKQVTNGGRSWRCRR